MKIRINHNTRNLSVAAFRAFGTDSERAAEQAAEEAEQALLSDYMELFDSIVTGKISYFYYENKPHNGRTLINVWTLSARPGVIIQRTAFLHIIESDELVSLSHHDIVDFGDMVKDLVPDEVEIFTV